MAGSIAAATSPRATGEDLPAADCGCRGKTTIAGTSIICSWWRHPAIATAALARIEARGLKCDVHYRWPIHLMRGYDDLGYREGQFPVAENKAQRIFSLPMYPHLKDEEVDEVIEVVRAAI